MHLTLPVTDTLRFLLGGTRAATNNDWPLVAFIANEAARSGTMTATDTVTAQILDCLVHASRNPPDTPVWAGSWVYHQQLAEHLTPAAARCVSSHLRYATISDTGIPADTDVVPLPERIVAAIIAIWWAATTLAPDMGVTGRDLVERFVHHAALETALGT